MFKPLCIVLAGFFAVALTLSCDPDKTTVDRPFDPPSPFNDLKQKDGVLVNLELLFNEFNATEYDRLLDADFVFFFSDADFSSSKTPEQWFRDIEIISYQGFYDKNRSKDRVISRLLNLTYAADNWTEITPDDPVTYPDESWFVSTVAYDMSVVLDTTPELTLVSNWLKAEITIRWADDLSHWRIIRWRDDVEGGLLVSGTETAVEGTSWGGIKALYRD